VQTGQDDQRFSSSGSPSLRPGTRVILVPDPAREHPSTDAHNTVVAHVDAYTERLIVEWPVVANEPLAVEHGLSLLVLITQTGDGLYSRPFVVENTQPAEPGTAGRAGWLVLRPTDLWQRIDRRRPERVVVSLPVARARRLPLSGGLLIIGCVVKDLSEGGFLLQADQRVGLADTIEVDLPLEDGLDPLFVRARVQRIQQGEASEAGYWLAGCKFEGLRSAEQGRIARFVAGHRRLGTAD